MFQCIPQLQPPTGAPGIGRFIDRTRCAEMWPKMASLPDSILQRKRTQRSRLPAPAFLLPSGILRQPDLSPAGRIGSTRPETPGCQPNDRAAKKDYHDLRPQGHQVEILRQRSGATPE